MFSQCIQYLSKYGRPRPGDERHSGDILKLTSATSPTSNNPTKYNIPANGTTTIIARRMSNHPSDTIIRSFPILLSYLCLAASLTIHSCRTIHSRYQFRQKHNDWAPAQRRQFFIFATLAALSLGATWYYMFAFFAHSYRSWEAQAGRAVPLSLVPRLEMWLRNTKLFREAWETVMETPARFWWSGQIFLWTTGWSVFLGLMGMYMDIELRSFGLVGWSLIV